MERMQEIKRKLVESGVIGRVLDDFNPHLDLILGYDDTLISIGDEVTLDEVQHPPAYLEQRRHPLDLELLETFMSPELVAVVLTDPDAPGGEYLQWLTMLFISLEHDIDSPPIEVLAYEPPRSGAHMLVLTVFKTDEFELIAEPNSRANFSTRTFAHSNALGPPLGASFFNIKYENEDEKHKNEGNEPSRKAEENGSASDLKEIAESSNKRRRTSLRNNNEEKNRKNDESESSA